MLLAEFSAFGSDEFEHSSFIRKRKGEEHMVLSWKNRTTIDGILNVLAMTGDK